MVNQNNLEPTGCFQRLEIGVATETTWDRPKTPGIKRNHWGNQDWYGGEEPQKNGKKRPFFHQRENMTSTGNHCSRKSQSLLGKSTISMGHFR